MTAYNISIHALREEGDDEVYKIILETFEFLSTPSARRATPALEALVGVGANFYPRPPRGGRRIRYAGTDAEQRYFYPRPPRGGRRCRCVRCRPEHGISIHALREEGDLVDPEIVLVSKGFLSTPSARRATRARMPTPSRSTLFLSTPSARRATCRLQVGRIRIIQFLSTPSARRATAKTEKNISAFVSL